MDEIMCPNCREFIKEGQTCSCGLLSLTKNSVHNSVDSVEISTAARALQRLDERGFALVKKNEHTRALESQYFLSRMAPFLDKLLDPEITVLKVLDVIDELKKMKAGGWF